RLNQTMTQDYGLLDNPQKMLVHAYADAAELGRIYPTKLSIHATPQRLASALDKLAPRAAPVWAGETAIANRDYREFTDTPLPQPGPVNLSTIMIWLREHLPADAIITNGAGAFASWIHRFYRFRRLGAHIAPLSQSMGYGLPAAIAMKRLYPE